MRNSVFPGDRMVFSGTVSKVERDAAGCGWAEVAVELKVGERVCTTCNVRIAIPVDPSDNPWKRKGDQWKP
jgi:hypothetical protein